MAYLLLAALIFLADFFVKSQIEARKPSDFPVELSHGLKLERHHNRGFFLNRLEEKPRLVRALAACAAVPLALWCVIAMAKKGGAVKKTAAAFLLGGAASNLFDRFTRGYVVDYLRLSGAGIKKIRNIIFNIADFFLFLGAALLAVRSLFSK